MQHALTCAVLHDVMRTHTRGAPWCRPIAALLSLLACTANAEPVSVFAPRILADGSREWSLMVSPPSVTDEAWIARQIATHIGQRTFCPAGWEIIERKVEKKQLIIEGRCK